MLEFYFQYTNFGLDTSIFYEAIIARSAIARHSNLLSEHYPNTGERSN